MKRGKKIDGASVSAAKSREAGPEASRKAARKKRSFMVVNKHFEVVLNAESSSAIILQRSQGITC